MNLIISIKLSLIHSILLGDLRLAPFSLFLSTFEFFLFISVFYLLNVHHKGTTAAHALGLALAAFN
jgi:hypothetical protein